MSIPVTIRTLIKRWQTMKSRYKPPNPDYSVSIGGVNADPFNQLQSSEVSCGTESQQSQQTSGSVGNQQIPGMINASALSSGNLPGRISSTSAAKGSTSTASGNNNFSAPQSQNPMDILSNYMTPFLSNQLGMGGNFANLSGLSLQSFPNVPNMAMQMNMSMLAAQMQNQNQKSAPMLMNLLDQVGQRGRRRKRKGTSNDSPTNNSNQGNTNIPHPSPSPSPKSPRAAMQPGRSPKRRLSDGSDVSGDSQGDSRAGTPQTPTGSAYGGMFGNDQFQQQQQTGEMKWNVDITPVNNESIDALLASKLMQNVGTSGKSSEADVILSSEYDMEMDPDLKSVKRMQSNTSNSKKARDFLKRSMSLDSHSNMDDHSGLQSLMQSGAEGAQGASGDNLRSLMPPSLSITPVSSSSHGGGNSNVNSLLASIRPGIEIIPLPTPVSIPSSVTVTPIMSKSGLLDKKLLLKDKKLSDDKKLDKKERKRKGEEDGFMESKHSKLQSGGFAQGGNVFMTIEKSKSLGINKTLTTMSGMNVTPVKKSTTAPSMNRPPMKSSSPTPKVSSGKPSVSTLKSVSSSPKYQSDSSGISSTTGSSLSTKMKSKDKKPGQSNKAVKNLIGLGSGGTSGMPAIPTLKPMSSVDNTQLSSALANLSQSLFKSNSELNSNKSETSSSNSGSNNNKSDFEKSGNSSSKTSDQTKPSIYQAQSQAAAAAAAAIAAQKSAKKGGLLAVIDKLKSQHSVDSDSGSGGSNGGNGNGSKKEPSSKPEGVKSVSSEGKKVLGGPSSSGSSATAGVPQVPGGNGSGSGTTGTGSSEYMVKPGGQGLKLTINKTIRPKDLGGLGKDKSKLVSSKPSTGSGSLLTKKPGTPPLIKPIAGLAKSPVSSNNGSSITGSIVTSGNPSKKSTSSNSTIKESSPKSSSKTSKDFAAGKAQVEMDLTKTLFMPGSVRCLDSTGTGEAPKFDSKFQIPKKSRSSTPSIPTVTSSSSSDIAPATKPEKDISGKDKMETPAKSSFHKDSGMPNITSQGESSIGFSDSSNSQPSFQEQENCSKGTKSDDSATEENKSEPPALLPMTSLPTYETNPVEPIKQTPASEPDSTTAEVVSSSSQPTIEPTNEANPAPVHVDEKISTTRVTTGVTVSEKRGSPGTKEIFTSPASPDPLSSTSDEQSYKAPATIPTTPLNAAPVVEPSPPIPMSPVPSPEEDQLIMDIPSERVFSNSEQQSTPKPPQPSVQEQLPTVSSDTVTDSQLSDKMPPPPVPSLDSSLAGQANKPVLSPSPSSTSANTAGSAPTCVSAAVPISNVGGGSSSSTSSVMSPSSSGSSILRTSGASEANSSSDIEMEDIVVPIVSVHILHSPQPKSPLLKSPLVVPSPHSSHASPYAIDDELMDEALIGTGK